jgi:Sulfotransferase family
MVAQLDRTFIRIAPGRAASRLVGYSLFEGRPATTTGRWWNPVVFRNLRFAAGRLGKPVDRPVFIVGMGRSGTTLLGRILAAHPSVGFLNEPKALWHVTRDDEDIIGSYAPPHTGRLYLGAEDADEEVSQRGRALFAWYLQASRSERIVDKYPELIFRHAFVRAIFPDARFLIAVRSPWSTLKSVAWWSESHATDDADWWGVRDQKWDILWTQGVVQRTSNSDLLPLRLANENNNHVRAALEWIVTMREAISLAAVDPLAQVIRYEELVRHPQELIRKTLRFCELPASPRTEAYADAIVSTQESKSDRKALSSLLPDELASAIDDTWSRLDIVKTSTIDQR